MKNIRPPYLTFNCLKQNNMFITFTEVAHLYMADNTYHITFTNKRCKQLPVEEYALVNACLELSQGETKLFREEDATREQTVDIVDE